MNGIIVIAGVLGLACAGYGLVAVSMNAWRRRRYVDVAVAVVAAAATVILLIGFGDRLIR